MTLIKLDAGGALHWQMCAYVDLGVLRRKLSEGVGVCWSEYGPYYYGMCIVWMEGVRPGPRGMGTASEKRRDSHLQLKKAHCRSPERRREDVS
jgi:hypothetical protein